MFQVARLRAELGAERRQRERECGERARLEREVEQLRVELGAMEALQGGHGGDESALQLGLGGAAAEAEVSSNQRVREELHRSLVSNRTKREEISRLEASLRSRDRQLEAVQAKEHQHLHNIETLRNDLHSASINASQSSHKTSSKEEELRAELKELQAQNTELKKHISEIVEGNDADKQEAIDELREEYELHVQEAVQETKTLMETEMKKLQIEIEVYDKTLVELRDKMSATEAENQKCSSELQELRCKSYEARKVEDDTLHKELEARLRSEVEQEFATRLEQSKLDLREMWRVEARLQAEEAVAAARLEWIKNLPGIQKNEGVRESIGELERVRDLLSREKDFKNKLEGKLAEKETEVNKLLESQRMLQRKVEESKREGIKEVEDSLGRELKETLRQQQEQWETIVRSTREESEVSRQQLVQHWENQVDLLEEKVRSSEKERMELRSKERQSNVIIEQMKRTLNDKELMLERFRKNKVSGEEGAKKDREVRLLQDELQRRNDDVQRQREEMTSLVSKWQKEMEGIQSSHLQEKQELEETRSKYHLLKSKVRKYQKHVEAKEDHYKSEYARLEAEFRGTLEKLRERMEAAYSSKERLVDSELGQMRDQLSREMRNIIRTGDSHSSPVDSDLLSEKPVKLVN